MRNTSIKQELEYKVHLDHQLGNIVLNEMDFGVIIISINNRIEEINENAKKILGICDENIRKHNIDEIFYKLPVDYQLIQRSMIDGIVFRNHAVLYRNGEHSFELLIDTSLIKDNFGKTTSVCLLMRDITNKRSLEHQLYRADRLALIGQVAAGTAHEIRNPLTAIRGFIQLFQKKFINQTQIKEQTYLRLMMSEIDRINHLVNEFLLMSKPKIPSYKSICVQEVLENLMPIIQSEGNLNKVQIHSEYIDQYLSFSPTDFQCPRVVCDADMLKQVFLNITRNAIEAMPDGGLLSIKINVDQSNRRLLIRFTDNGIGIPPYMLDKLFDPFVSTKPSGTGLGLSICQKIIHDLGGQIQVFSKGFGTTFQIALPYSSH